MTALLAVKTGPGSVVGDQAYVMTRDTAIAELPDWLADILEDHALGAAQAGGGPQGCIRATAG